MIASNLSDLSNKFETHWATKWGICMLWTCWWETWRLTMWCCRMKVGDQNWCGKHHPQWEVSSGANMWFLFVERLQSFSVILLGNSQKIIHNSQTAANMLYYPTCVEVVRRIEVTLALICPIGGYHAAMNNPQALARNQFSVHSIIRCGYNFWCTSSWHQLTRSYVFLGGWCHPPVPTVVLVCLIVVLRSCDALGKAHGLRPLSLRHRSHRGVDLWRPTGDTGLHCPRGPFGHRLGAKNPTKTKDHFAI